MLGEDELYVCLTCVANLAGISVDYHTLDNCSVAGSGQLLHTLNLNYAHTARTNLVESLPVAKCRDVDACAFRCFEDGNALVYAYILTVNC